VTSRRRAEALILEGRVKVNGVVVRELGYKVDPKLDVVEVRGRRVEREAPVYVLLNKPRGTVTTRSDPEGRPTVVELLAGVEARVFPVGRLDFNTAGPLLLTNDGELAQALAHPSSGVPRVYRVKVSGSVTAEQLELLREGVDIGDGPARASEVLVAGRAPRQTTLVLTLVEGRYHQIHRMIEAIGHTVMRLTRLTFAGLDVDGLRPGQHRYLARSEIATLKRLYLGPYRHRRRSASRLP
jgi:23S rRNA pseudouridine2605 synthase